jgi:hypothetical protein
MSYEALYKEHPDETKQIVVINGDWMSYETDERILAEINGLELIHVRSGLDFLEVFGVLRTRQPKLIIGEINLPLMHPMPNMPRPPRNLELGCYDIPNTVGLRCLQMVDQDSSTNGVPILLATLFDDNDLKTLPSGLKVPEKARVINKLDKGYEQMLRAEIEAALV